MLLDPRFLVGKRFDERNLDKRVKAKIRVYAFADIDVRSFKIGGDRYFSAGVCLS